MRTLVGALVAVLLSCAACTSGSDDGPDTPRTSATPAPTTTKEPRAVSLASAGIEWPAAQDELTPAAVPDPPDGFDAALLGRMAGIITDWAQASTLDEDTWYSATPVDDVVAALPERVGSALRDRTKDAVSPGLAVATTFAEEVTVVGAPRVTTAWKQSTEVDDDGRQYVLLELQTRAAYEVRLGDDAPTRVIGVLRVHGLSAYPDTTDDFGVSGGWQEFGAIDCALALDDDLIPDGNLEAAATDLETFVGIGDGTTVEMPSLGDDEKVDAEYLQRCAASST